MRQKKCLKELTIKDNFMFGAVMSDAENCRRFLEMAAGFSIERVEVIKEKSMVYHPEYKGVRLDVFARDEKNTHYNVEMQMLPQAELGRRSRYYHGQMDAETLLSGSTYGMLPDSYVIFICDFDPFGEKKYRYTFENRCLENTNLGLGSGERTLFLSTAGENEEDEPEELVQFLKYVKADLEESESSFEDEYVQTLQKAVRHVKESRELEEKFMVLEEMLQDEREEGKIEGREEGRTEGRALAVIELLETIGEVPQSLREKILGQTDTSVLSRWLKLAARAQSIEQFEKNL